MAIQKTLSALAILVAITVAAAAVGEQPPIPVSLNPAAYGTVDGTALGLPHSQSISPIDPDGFGKVPDHPRSAQAYGICIDLEGFGRIPDHLLATQSYGCYIDPYGFGTIPESREMER